MIKTLNCARCGCPFHPSPRRTKFCSRQCSDARDYVRAKRTCVICGDIFPRRQTERLRNFRKRQTCGPQCYSELRQEISELLREIADQEPEYDIIEIEERIRNLREEKRSKEKCLLNHVFSVAIE